MTSYITITDAETDPEAPLTSELAKKWRDNPIAMFEGEVDAPKLAGRAVARDYNNSLPIVTVTAGDVISNQGEGLVEGVLTTSSTTNVVAAKYTIKAYTGTLRFRAVHVASGGVGSSFLEIYKNNVLVQAYSTGSTSAPRQNDISIVPGDVIEWRHRASGGSASVLTNVSVRANNPYVEQPTYRLSSEVLV